MKSIYNPLTDQKPVEYKGYKINTSFKVVLKFFRLLKDQDFDEEERTITALQMFFYDGVNKVNMQDCEELIKYIEYYVKLGDESEEEESEDKGIFNFDIDSGRIYSAFLQIYNIDLTKIDLHWWDFSTLLNGLPSGTKLADVIEIRATDVPKTTDSNRDYVRQIRELKRVYAIETEKPTDQLGDIFNSWR